MFSIEYAVYLFVIATWLAWLEVQIEGKDSWAAKLPCWRPNPKWIVARIYSWFMGGLPLTGYHAVMFSFVLIILHLPFTAGIKWSIVNQLKVFSVFFILAANWDFLYFVWNPYFTLRGSGSNSITRHKNWLLKIFPKDYSKAIGISFSFVVIAGFLEEGSIAIVITSWIRTLLILGVLTLLSCITQVLRGRI